MHPFDIAYHYPINTDTFYNLHLNPNLGNMNVGNDDDGREGHEEEENEGEEEGEEEEDGDADEEFFNALQEFEGKDIAALQAYIASHPLGDWRVDW